VATDAAARAAPGIYSAVTGPGDALYGRDTAASLENRAIAAAPTLAGIGSPAAEEGALGVFGGKGAAGEAKAAYPVKMVKTDDTAGGVYSDTMATFYSRDAAGRQSEKYNVYFEPKGNSFEFHFSNDDPMNEAGNAGITNLEPRTAPKVLASVIDAARQHLEEHPEYKTVEIKADNSDPSRVKLYGALARRFSSSVHTEVDSGYTRFVMPRSSIKGLTQQSP
jgi:hypothetical protein